MARLCTENNEFLNTGFFYHLVHFLADYFNFVSKNALKTLKVNFQKLKKNKPSQKLFLETAYQSSHCRLMTLDANVDDLRTELVGVQCHNSTVRTLISCPQGL